MLFRTRPRVATVVVTVMTLAALVAGCGDDGIERTKGVITNGGKISVHDLRPGDCFDRPEDNEDEDVDKVDAKPCTDEHTEEVYAKVTYTGSKTYPNAKVMEKYANTSCETAYRPYVGVAYDASKLLFTYLAPSESGWEKDKDRTILCVITSKNPREKSAKGSKA